VQNASINDATKTCRTLILSNDYSVNLENRDIAAFLLSSLELSLDDNELSSATIKKVTHDLGKLRSHFMKSHPKTSLEDYFIRHLSPVQTVMKVEKKPMMALKSISCFTIFFKFKVVLTKIHNKC
jgi:hypothetical protein